MSSVNPSLAEFYAEIDEQARRLEEIHAARLKCRLGCSSCCVDGITVFEVEAANIRQNHSPLLATEQPNTSGGCAFLDGAGACRIYESRPYVCRTQGLPLRWIEEIEDELYELRDICPLNDEGEPVEEIEPDKCWTIGDFEARLAELQFEHNKGKMRRIALRDLFEIKEKI
jgi:uncharacterized protein